MKRRISFEKLSKRNEIEKRKTNRDNFRKIVDETKKRKENATLKKIDEKASYDLEIEDFTRSNARFRSFFFAKRRRDTNTDTDSETLRRLAMIVTVLIKSYFSTDDIAEFIDESEKRKRRTLTQVSEIFTKLSKR